jgi:hypothetical protein
VVSVDESMTFFLLQGPGVSSLPAGLRQAVEEPWQSRKLRSN